jgi:hypothetical protein
LVEAVRDAFREARELFAESASGEVFNRSVREAVGPMVLRADGRVVQKQVTRPEGRVTASVV